MGFTATCRIPVSADRSLPAEPDDDCLSWNDSLSRWQTDSSTTSICFSVATNISNREQGLFAGGNFWDSRATGYRLRQFRMRNKRRGHRSILWKWAFPDTACHRLPPVQCRVQTASMKSYGGAAHSTSSSRPTRRRFAGRLVAQRYSGTNDEMPVQLSPEDRTRANERFT